MTAPGARPSRGAGAAFAKAVRASAQGNRLKENRALMTARSAWRKSISAADQERIRADDPNGRTGRATPRKHPHLIRAKTPSLHPAGFPAGEPRP